MYHWKGIKETSVRNEDEALWGEKVRCGENELGNGEC
jgi:hypothetical protein